MTKISQYTEITAPALDDLLIGTDVSGSDATKNFTIQSVVDLVEIGVIPTLQQVTTAGNTTNKSVLITLSSGTLPALIANTIDVTSIAGRSVNQAGVFGSSDNGVGGRFSTGTISTANIVEFLKLDQVQAYITHDGIAQSNRLLINTTSINASAQAQIDSTTKGFLPPRMTTVQKDAILTPTPGLVVYDTTLNKLCVRGASAWQTITSV
jgi:hypothetical protein